mgnify:CR=1 FL=1
MSAAGGADLLRLIDANGNRAAEGLRVLEDLARFLFNDADLSRQAKDLRHALRQALPPAAAGARDTAGDVGTGISTVDEGVRARPLDLLRANAARAQEALRVLEEALKLTGPAVAAASIEQVRYGTYRLESGLLARLPAWRFWQVRLYVLVDTGLCADPVAVAAAAVRGGAGAVQLRAKGLSVRAYRELAARMQEAVRGVGGLFVVNDHVAVARALAADGCHVGQDDLSLADARAVVGPCCALGASCHTRDQLLSAQAEGADVCGLGPMFATTTKPHEPERGPALLEEVQADLRLPSFAIGGLDLERVRALRPRLPHGIAVAGALCRAADPERAAAAFVEALA